MNVSLRFSSTIRDSEFVRELSTNTPSISKEAKIRGIWARERIKIDSVNQGA
jgi:hypothetical protein